MHPTDVLNVAVCGYERLACGIDIAVDACSMKLTRVRYVAVVGMRLEGSDLCRSRVLRAASESSSVERYEDGKHDKTGIK
jgi:hypothetical protein